MTTRSIVYKIVSTKGDMCYVGSTTKTLRERFDHHKNDYRTDKAKCMSRELFDMYGVDTCIIVPIREFDDIDPEVLRVHEALWVLKLRPNSVNVCLPFGEQKIKWLRVQYKKQWQEEHKEEITERRKQRYEEHKEEILARQSERSKLWRERHRDELLKREKLYREQHRDELRERARERVQCGCGSIVRRDSLTKHRRTKKHQDWLLTQSND